MDRKELDGLAGHRPIAVNSLDTSSDKLKKAKFNIVASMLTLLCLAVAIGVVGIYANKKTTSSMVQLHEGLLDMRRQALQLNADVLRIYVAMRDLAMCEPFETERVLEIEQNIKAEKVWLEQHYLGLVQADLELHVFRSELSEVQEALKEWGPIRDKNIFLAGHGYMEERRQSIRTTESSAVTRINKSIDALVAVVMNEGVRAFDKAENEALKLQSFLSTATLAMLLLGVLITVYEIVSTNKAIFLVGKTQKELSDSLDVLVEKDKELRKSMLELDSEINASNEMRERYVNSLDAAKDVIFEGNRTTGEFFVSNKWREVTNRKEPLSFAKKELFMGIPKKDQEKLMRIMDIGQGHFEVDFRLIDEENHLRWIRLKCKWMEEKNEKPFRLMGSLSDVTQNKVMERKMEYLARHDVLTNLPNRSYFVEKLERAIASAQAERKQLALIFLDMDNFKEINDTHGHSFGDELLKMLAERFKQFCKRSSAVLARFGGDEFLFLLPDCDKADDAYAFAEELRLLALEPLVLGKTETCISTSIGVANFPNDGNTADMLMKNVDSAMYESKKAGGNRISFYDSAMSKILLRKTHISHVLRTAIEEGKVSLAYQPQYHTGKKTIASVEALMRIHDKQLGFVSPVEFIPIAETTQLIVPLGYWAMEEAICCDKRLQEKGVQLNNIAVNISEIQLREEDFIENVQAILEKHKYNPQRLHFEITESVFLSDVENKIIMFEKLKKMGIQIELDDFGTGYSSLNYLRIIPLDVIKIDKCFVDDIGKNKRQEALLELMVDLRAISQAHSIAEGVETADQAQFLTEKGATLLQGYYYSKPLPEQDLACEIERLNSGAYSCYPTETVISK